MILTSLLITFTEVVINNIHNLILIPPAIPISSTLLHKADADITYNHIDAFRRRNLDWTDD